VPRHGDPANGAGLMGGLSIWHWIVVLVVVLLLFGRGKISEIMGDMAKGIKEFKRGMAEEDSDKTDQQKTIDHQTASQPSAVRTESEKKVG
jgi:sec-independent protein translocase protein TatA